MNAQRNRHIYAKEDSIMWPLLNIWMKMPSPLSSCLLPSTYLRQSLIYSKHMQNELVIFNHVIHMERSGHFGDRLPKEDGLPGTAPNQLDAR